MKLSEAFRGKPMEIASALTMFVVGIFLLLTAPSRAGQALSGILFTAGGALLSWSTARIATLDQAREILKPPLETISRHLGTASGQINRVVQQVYRGEHDADYGIALISQLTGTLYQLVNDLQILTNSQFQSQILLGTVESLEETTTKMAETLSNLGKHEPEAVKQEGANGAVNELRKDLSNLQAQLQSTRQQLVKPERRTEELVQCPDCTTRVAVLIGSSKGDSAIALCPTCGKRFHVHRGSGNKLFCQRWGGGGSEEFNIQCPECSTVVPMTLRAGAPPSRVTV